MPVLEENVFNFGVQFSLKFNPTIDTSVIKEKMLSEKEAKMTDDTEIIMKNIDIVSNELIKLKRDIETLNDKVDEKGEII